MFWSMRDADARMLRSADELREPMIRFFRNVAERLEHRSAEHSTCVIFS